ncbi:MAG: radical SAM protein [Thermoanaerobaculia bacterium]
METPERVLTYTEFSARLHEQVVRTRTPVDVTIEVTRRCPLVCSHCYNNLPMGDRAAQLAELSTEEHYRLLDQLADAGCLWLLFTGGEIFARRDFMDIYKYSKQKGFFVTLFTNGTLITPKIADTLLEWRPFAIEITLYGRTRETYERLTGVPGSYDRCLNGIQLLKERGLPLTIKTVAVSINRHEIWEMKRFVEEELKLPFKFDAMMTPRIDCSQSPLEVRLSPVEIVELDLLDPRRTEEWKEFAEVFIGPQQRAGHEEDVYHCGGGINSCSIDPLGKMSICVISHQEGYDLRNGSVEEGWNTFLAKVRDKQITRVTKCTKCQLKSVCGMCPANAELENGDPEAPVEFLCHVAHLRAHLLGWKIPAHGTCEFCPDGTEHDGLLVEVEGLKARAAQGGWELSQYPEPPTGAAPTGCGSGGGCGSCRVAE